MGTVSLVQPRIYAWIIDALLCLGLGGLFGRLGWIASTGYWLLRDGLFEGQSVGKRIMRLKVSAQRSAKSRSPFVGSCLRNVLWVVPVINLLMGATGLYELLRTPDGRHWGDLLADTRVVKA